MKPLLIAEAANPDWVSVPLVGWSLAKAILDETGGHLVTQIRNREAILRAGLVENEDFTVIDTENIARPAWRLAQVLRMGDRVGHTMVTAVMSLTYSSFERKVWTQFRDRLHAGEFDVVHRITPLTPTANSPLAHLCNRINVPFVLGPLNGGVPWPRQFDRERRQEKEWLSYVRGIYRFNPARRRMLENTDAILCGSRHVISEIPARFREKCFHLPENGIDHTRFNLDEPLVPRLRQAPLRACFIGRLVPYKGADMLIEAAAPLMKSGKMTIDILGDGPVRDALNSQIDELGVGSSVKMHGWIDHMEVQRIASGCDILAFPSIREFGGGVVLEAMAMGIVPIVVDYGGPGELVIPDVGAKVPLGTRDEIVTSMRTILEDLATNPDKLKPMAQAGRNLVRTELTWETKARQVLRVYEAIADKTPLEKIRPLTRLDIPESS